MTGFSVMYFSIIWMRQWWYSNMHKIVAYWNYARWCIIGCILLRISDIYNKILTDPDEMSCIVGTLIIMYFIWLTYSKVKLRSHFLNYSNLHTRLWCSLMQKKVVTLPFSGWTEILTFIKVLKYFTLESGNSSKLK